MIKSASIFFALMFLCSCEANASSPAGAVPASVAPSFDTTYEWAVAANPSGVYFTLSTVDGRTTYHCGERIPVQLILSTHIPNTYICAPFFSGRMDDDGLDEFYCDPSSGVTDPYAGTVLGLLALFGQGLESVPKLTDQPTIADLDLNDWIAFDRPGTYRVYATTQHVWEPVDQSDPKKSHLRVLTTASTVLTLTIEPANDAWASQSIAGASLQPSDTTGYTSDLSVKTLGYLRTSTAAFALLHVLETDANSPSIHDEIDRECSDYLIQSPYRIQVVPAMERDIADPDAPLSTCFLNTYTELLPSSDDPQGRMLALLKAALPHKRGMAATISRAAMIELRIKA